MQVPTLETPTGGVWESNAIARYVARLSDKGLFGTSQYEEVCLLLFLSISASIECACALQVGITKQQLTWLLLP